MISNIPKRPESASSSGLGIESIHTMMQGTDRIAAISLMF